EAERGRCGARAEPALERDAVDEGEAVVLRPGEEREGAQCEVRRVARQLRRALALDLDAGPVRDIDFFDGHLVPELERGRGRVEPRTEVGRRSGCDHPDRQDSASSTASSVGSTTASAGWGTASTSFRP